MTRVRLEALIAVVLLTGILPCRRLQAQSGQTTVVGYALVSPGAGISPTSLSLQVYQTVGFRQGEASLQAETPAAQMTTSALLFVNMSDSLVRNTGVAIANPDTVTTQINMELYRSDGILAARKIIQIPGRQQIAQLVTQLFADQPGIPRDFTGTLKLTASNPVAIVALRFRGSTFSTETLSQLSAATPVPPIVPGVTGGGSSFILPNFVSGGGWATEIIVINTGSSPTAVRLDLFSAGGSPMTATLNGVTGSIFADFSILAGGVLVIAPTDSRGNSQF